MAGIVGAVLEAKYPGDLVDAGRVIYDPTRGKRVTEYDVELKFANVEVKTGENAADIEQVDKQLNDKRANPTGLSLVVYAPKATKNQIREITNKGAFVVKDLNQLLKTLEALRNKNPKEPK